jgi:hypothetical protein
LMPNPDGHKPTQKSLGFSLTNSNSCPKRNHGGAPQHGSEVGSMLGFSVHLAVQRSSLGGIFL